MDTARWILATGMGLPDGGAFGHAMSPGSLVQNMGTVGRITFAMLLAMSAASVFVMVDRAIALFQARRQSRSMLGDFIDRVRKGDLRGALEAARSRKRSHVAQVMKIGLQVYAFKRKAAPEVDPLESVQRAMERASLVEADRLKRGIGLLATVGSTAPFVGLFGTVVGIINAFHSIGAAQGGGIGIVIGGIAEALVATAVGLCVAIPAVWGYNALSTKTNRLTLEMDNAGAELLDIFATWQAQGIAPLRAPAR